ncbi:hypothetical protein Tco_1069579 [Tanacetum coccineum]|uniref:Retrovirus-related Pol polyprotein from transposon TNT 1-94 n=1 Tax=Tanacetum coccineum TaxID=301880 RepID=A0ABQ5HKU5_9ASTR
MEIVEVPQILKYTGGRLNVAPVLEVENFTNWKKRYDLILYHEGPSNVKESRVMDMKLCYNTFKFKEGGSLTQTFTRYKALMNELVNDGIKLLKLEMNTGFINGLPKKWLSFYQSLKNTNHVKDSELASLFDSPDDEEDTRSSHEYLNDLEEEYQARALLAKSKRFFKKGTQRFSSAKDDEEVSSDENEVTEFKDLMALTVEERVSIDKESARNDYLCIDLNYVEEQRNNIFSKYRNLVQELNTCKEQLLVLNQAKLDLLTMQHVNTKILKENQNLIFKLKELTSIKETWLNSSNKVNQYINGQIPTQKKKILGINQLIKDTSSFGSKHLVFVKYLANYSYMSITGSNIPKSSKTEDSTLPNQDTDKVPLNESQRNTTDPSVVISNTLATNYDSACRIILTQVWIDSLRVLEREREREVVE